MEGGLVCLPPTIGDYNVVTLFVNLSHYNVVTMFVSVRL